MDTNDTVSKYYITYCFNNLKGKDIYMYSCFRNGHLVLQIQTVLTANITLVFFFKYCLNMQNTIYETNSRQCHQTLESVNVYDRKKQRKRIQSQIGTNSTNLC